MDSYSTQDAHKIRSNVWAIALKETQIDAQAITLKETWKDAQKMFYERYKKEKCLFHVLRTFRREVTMEKLHIKADQRNTLTEATWASDLL